MSHVQLARSGSLLSTMWDAIDHQRARSADPLTTVRIKRERFVARLDEILVHDIQHFEEGHVGDDVTCLASDKLSAGLTIFLPPNF